MLLISIHSSTTATESRAVKGPDSHVRASRLGRLRRWMKEGKPAPMTVWGGLAVHGHTALVPRGRCNPSISSRAC